MNIVDAAKVLGGSPGLGHSPEDRSLSVRFAVDDCKVCKDGVRKRLKRQNNAVLVLREHEQAFAMIRLAKGTRGRVP